MQYEKSCVVKKLYIWENTIIIRKRHFAVVKGGNIDRIYTVYYAFADEWKINGAVKRSK